MLILVVYDCPVEKLPDSQLMYAIFVLPSSWTLDAAYVALLEKKQRPHSVSVVFVYICRLTELQFGKE
jgi:hypothetical protein